MKSDSFKNKQKALAALLICFGFLTGHPSMVLAESNATIVQVAQQKKLHLEL